MKTILPPNRPYTSLSKLSPKNKGALIGAAAANSSPAPISAPSFVGPTFEEDDHATPLFVGPTFGGSQIVQYAVLFHCFVEGKSGPYTHIKPSNLCVREIKTSHFHMQISFSSPLLSELI